MKTKRLLFITAHPDDESLWCPGIIKLMASLPQHEVNVLCLWGLLENPDPYREKQFYEATAYLGAKSYIFTKNENSFLEFGFNKLGLNIGDVDLVVTHSPYGDEHEHSHHIHCYQLSKALAQQLQCGFTYFTFITPPDLYSSLMNAGFRYNDCHLVNQLKSLNNNNKTFYQFSFDYACKQKALSHYQNINIPVHAKGYYAWTSPLEGYMCEDERSTQFFDDLLKIFLCPAEKKLFNI